MAKKSNRSKAKAAAKPVAKPATIEDTVKDEVEEVAITSPSAASPRVPKVAKMNRSQVAAERIEDEYAYITSDLRRVFILAAAMFALLIALNVILGMMG